MLVKILHNFLLFFAIIFSTLVIGQENLNVKKIKSVLLFDIHSTINPATFNYLNEGMKKAKSQGVDLLLIKLNTPGGLVSTTKDIISLLASSSIPVAVWVGPDGASATSAGALISASAHFLFMAPGTNIGAATPIDSGGDIKSVDLRAKSINDLKALVRALSEARGRNPEAFEAMIETAASFSSKQALEKKLIDAIVSSEIEVVKSLNKKNWKDGAVSFSLEIDNPVLTEYDMDIGQRTLNTLSHPELAYILFILGALLVYFELQSPGGYIAGGIGFLSLILSGIGLQVLPLNFGALGLIVLAFILFIMELYITSFGLLTLGGLISLITGSLFLYRSDNSYVELGLPVIISTVMGIAIFVILIALYWWKEEKKKKIENDVGNKLVGKMAQIIASLQSEKSGIYLYHVKVSGEMWKATCQSSCEIGDWVSVIKGPSSELILEVSK